MKKILLMVLPGLFLLTGCLYKMPTEGYLSTLPNTNNPSVTGEKGSGFMLPRR